MVEIYDNISQEVKNTAETAWTLAVKQRSSVSIVDFLSKVTDYYRDKYTEEEIEFMQFYFYTRMEMMRK